MSNEEWITAGLVLFFKYKTIFKLLFLGQRYLAIQTRTRKNLVGWYTGMEG